MDRLPDATSLINQLKEAVDVCKPKKTRNHNGDDQQESNQTSTKKTALRDSPRLLSKLMLQSTNSQTHNENNPASTAHVAVKEENGSTGRHE